MALSALPPFFIRFEIFVFDSVYFDCITAYTRIIHYAQDAMLTSFVLRLTLTKTHILLYSIQKALKQYPDPKHTNPSLV